MTSVSEVTSTSAYSNIQKNGVVCSWKTGHCCQIKCDAIEHIWSTEYKAQRKSRTKTMQWCQHCWIKQSIECVEKVTVQCKYIDVTRNVNFYVTSIADSKVILGLSFCKTFGLVSVNCDKKCQCKQISLDITNNEFPQELSVPDSIKQTKLSPVDINSKLPTYNMKAHIMELFSNLYDGIGTIKDAIMNLDINPNVYQ